jgi:hypothetical protein
LTLERRGKSGPYSRSSAYFQIGVDVIAHGMWNGQRSTATALDKGVEPILREVVKRGMGYQPTAQVIRGMGAELDDQFLSDPLLSRVYPPELIA